MLRSIFSILVSVSIARWFYAEVTLAVPQAAPALDRFVNMIEIPTHDKWPKDSLNQIMNVAGSLTQTALNAISNGQSKSTAVAAKVAQPRLASHRELDELEGMVGVRRTNVKLKKSSRPNEA